MISTRTRMFSWLAIDKDASPAYRKLSYETWYGIHLYAYIGIALAFVHQLTMGSDLVDDPVIGITIKGHIDLAERAVQAASPGGVDHQAPHRPHRRNHARPRRAGP